MKVWYEVEFVSAGGGSVTAIKRFATYLDAKSYCDQDEGESRIVKVTETREVVE